MATVDIYKKNHRNEISDDYKKTQIGIIPKSWDVKTLSDIGEISSGSTPSRSNENYFNGNIPWVKTTDLNNSYIFETEEKITELALKETSLKLVEENSILIAMYGGFNQIGRTGLLRVKAATNQAISSVFVDEKEYNAEFVLHWLNAKRGLWKKFAASSRKDPNITKNDVENFPIVKPPYREQKRIAQILSTWDKAIELKEKLIEQKKEQKKGLMQRLLTGKVRLPGFEGEWKIKKIGDILVESLEIADKPDINKRITVRLNLKGVEKREPSAVEIEGATTQYIRRKGQFIYGKQNIHKGAFGIIPDYLDGFQSSIDLPSFDFKDGIDRFWFYYYFAREHFYKNLENIASGTGSKRVQPKDLFKIKIKVPPLEEQRKISAILQSVDKEIDLLEQELEALKQQKKGLMQLLLTGKVRVKC